MEKTEVKRRRVPSELSTDTRILYNVLEKGLIKDSREIVPYSELSEAIQRDVQDGARGILQTARRHIQKEHRVLLEPVINVGIKKTDDCEGVIDRCLGHVNRTVRRKSKEVNNAINDMEIDSSLAAKLSIAGLTELLTKRKAQKKLKAVLEERKIKEISTNEALKLFQEN